MNESKLLSNDKIALIRAWHEKKIAFDKAQRELDQAANEVLSQLVLKNENTKYIAENVLSVNVQISYKVDLEAVKANGLDAKLNELKGQVKEIEDQFKVPSKHFLTNFKQF